MINLRSILFLVMFFLAITEGIGQYELKGKVISEETKEPLIGVELFDNISGTIVVTDYNGEYLFTDLSFGLHELTLFSMDYESITQSVIVSKDQKLNFELALLSVELTEVEIAAKKEELFAIRQMEDVEGTSIYAGKKTEVIVMDLVSGNLANNNSRQVYAQVAGLNIYEGSDGGLQLNLGGRGLDPNRTSNFNTRQNGYDISADVLGYPENYYTPPSESISEIRILRGASSLQYGTQFGGLIDFRLRKIPSYKKLSLTTKQTVGSFNSYSSFNSIGGNIGKFSINSFYNYKRGEGYRSNSDYRSNNFFVSVDYKLSNKTNLSSEFTYFKYLAKQAGGLTDQQFSVDSRMSTRNRNWFEVDWKLYNFNLEHVFNAYNKLSLSIFGLDAARNSVGFRGNPINLNENPILSIDEQDNNGNYIYPRDLILGTFKNFGAEIRSLNKYNFLDRPAVFLIGSKYYKSNNSSMQGPGSIKQEADFNLTTDVFPDYANQSNFKFPNENIAVFTENIFYLTDKFSITPGLRFEYIKTKSAGRYNQVVFDNAGNPIDNVLLSEENLLKRNFLLMGLGLSYKKSQAFNFIFNVSQNYRSVTFSDIRIVSPTFKVDPEIGDEKGFTADLGIKGRLKKILSYDLTVYSVLYNDRIGIILDSSANRVRKNIGRALILGSESLLNLNFARWIEPNERDYKLDFFVNMAYTYSEYLASQENNVVGKKVEFIPELNFKSGISGGYKGLSAFMQFSFLSEQFTDVQNSGIATEGDIRSGVVGEIPSYYVLDGMISYKWKSFKIDLGIDNILNRSYFTRRATGYPGPGIIPSDGRYFYTTLSYKFDKR